MKIGHHHHHHHHHHYHVPEELGVFPFPWSSKWSWSLHLFFSRPTFLRPFGLYRNACFGILFVSLSVGPLLPFEDFTSSVCCPLDSLPACHRVSLVVGLPTWCL